jgi:ABC-2 type transport system ATP-binding protein
MQIMSHKKILEVTRLSKNFKRVHAVKDISFDMDEGDIFAFLGPNGAGKTTTLRILLDIIRADSGTISWNLNGAQTSLPDPTLVGYLPEERGLYPELPVLRTLVYLASIRGMKPTLAREAALQWLERLELADRANEKLQALSKGNQQKVQFIASIIHKPRFAILDEPFSGLDPLNQELFIGYIQELNQQGCTILLSAHQMQLVERIARKVFLINHGEEVFYGNLTDIYQNNLQQHTFDITFEGLAPMDIWNNMPEVENTLPDGPNKLHITFAPGMEIRKILAMLSTIEGISNIKSKNSNLHDIYLNLVSKREQNVSF